MHAAALLSVLATALAASAFQVTEPNANQGWVSTGSNTLSWERVSTDATNFTVYLTNTDRSVLPQNNLLLADFVDATTATSVAIQMPSSGFNEGGHYRVNLVNSQSNQAIYAQSEEFNITSGSSSATGSTASSGSTVSVSSGVSTTVSGSRTLTISSSPTGTGASASSSDLNPSSTANAAASRKAEFNLLAALLFLGGLLA